MDTIAVIRNLHIFMTLFSISCFSKYMCMDCSRLHCAGHCICDSGRISCSGLVDTSWEHFLSELPSVTNSISIRDSSFRQRGEALRTVLQNVRYLKLINTDVSMLPKDLFSPFPFLEELIMDNCDIDSSEPVFFHKLSHLQSLDVNQVEIDYIDIDTFKEMESLHSLVLSNNNMSSIHPNAFLGLKHLDRVDISFNAITHIHPRSFWGLPSLKMIDMQFNRLVTFHEDLVKNISNLEGISMFGNPLKCDCGLQWILERKATHTRDVVKPVHCWKDNQYLDIVSIPQLTCNPPFMVKDIENQAIYTRGGRVVDCVVSGDPSPEIYWVTPLGVLADTNREPWTDPATHYKYSTHKSIAFPSNENSQIQILRNSSLEFKNFRVSFIGEYACVAKNPAGFSTTKFNVTITSPLRGIVNISILVGWSTSFLVFFCVIIIILCHRCIAHLKKKNRNSYSGGVNEDDANGTTDEYIWYFHNLQLGHATRLSPKKCATPAEEQEAERRFSEHGANIMGLLVDTRNRLKLVKTHMEKRVSKIRAATATQAKKVKSSSHKAMESFRESRTKTAQSLRSSSSQAVPPAVMATLR